MIVLVARNCNSAVIIQSENTYGNYSYMIYAKTDMLKQVLTYSGVYLSALM